MEIRARCSSGALSKCWGKAVPFRRIVSVGSKIHRELTENEVAWQHKPGYEVQLEP